MVTSLNNRKVLGLKGSDCKKFLQNLISNDINLIDDGLVYSALLTPQGKYIADFFVVPLEDAFRITAVTPVLSGIGETVSMTGTFPGDDATPIVTVGTFVISNEDVIATSETSIVFKLPSSVICDGSTQYNGIKLGFEGRSTTLVFAGFVLERNDEISAVVPATVVQQGEVLTIHGSFGCIDAPSSVVVADEIGRAHV